MHTKNAGRLPPLGKFHFRKICVAWGKCPNSKTILNSLLIRYCLVYNSPIFIFGRRVPRLQTSWGCFPILSKHVLHMIYTFQCIVGRLPDGEMHHSIWFIYMLMRDWQECSNLKIAFNFVQKTADFRKATTAFIVVRMSIYLERLMKELNLRSYANPKLLFLSSFVGTSHSFISAEKWWKINVFIWVRLSIFKSKWGGIWWKSWLSKVENIPVWWENFGWRQSLYCDCWSLHLYQVRRSCWVLENNLHE